MFRFTNITIKVRKRAEKKYLLFMFGYVDLGGNGGKERGGVPQAEAKKREKFVVSMSLLSFCLYIYMLRFSPHNWHAWKHQCERNLCLCK